MCNVAKKNQKSAQVIYANDGNERHVDASAVSSFGMYEELNTAKLEEQQAHNYESLTHTDTNNAKTDGMYQQLDSASLQSQQPQHYEALSHVNTYANL